MTTVTSIAGETVDLICRRYYGEESGFAEAVYDANRGLAAYGAILPAGVVIVLPEIATTVKDDPVIRLWDGPDFSVAPRGVGRVEDGTPFDFVSIFEQAMQ